MKRNFLIGAAGAAALSLVLVAAGCGGSKSTSSDASVQWANSVCSATNAWKSQLSKLVGDVRANGLTQQSLQTTAASVQAVTKTYAETLKGLGAPKTDAGTQAKQSLDTLATQLSQGATTIRGALDSGSVTTAATTIATTFSSMKTNISSTVSTLQSLDPKGELKQAFQNADNCAGLVGA